MTQFVTVDRTTLEQMVNALENSIDDVRTYLADVEPLAGYARYDRRIAAYKEQVDAHEAAITQGRAALANAETAGWQTLVDQGKEAQELAKIMKDFADKNPKSLMLKESDK